MVAHAPLVPEIALDVGAEIFAMWQAAPDQPPPYYAFPWIGGQALARYVLDHRALVRGRCVLDVGTGSGLVAIAAALSGARDVRATDVDARAIAAAGRNAARNGVTLALIERDVLGEDVDADVILVGDLCYEQPLAERVLSFIHRQRATVLCGDPGRAYFDDLGFTQRMAYDVPTFPDLEGRAVRRAAVYELTSPRPRGR